MTAAYPEHEKLSAVKDESQKLGEFLEWLKGRYVLAQVHSHDEGCLCDDPFHEDADVRPGERCPCCGGSHRSLLCGYTEGDLMMASTPIRGVLADYFEIDLKKIEDEKRAMLAALRGEHPQ
jgi:hypothetical protein